MCCPCGQFRRHFGMWLIYISTVLWSRLKKGKFSHFMSSLSAPCCEWESPRSPAHWLCIIKHATHFFCNDYMYVHTPIWCFCSNWNSGFTKPHTFPISNIEHAFCTYMSWAPCRTLLPPNIINHGQGLWSRTQEHTSWKCSMCSWGEEGQHIIKPYITGCRAFFH